MKLPRILGGLSSLIILSGVTVTANAEMTPEVLAVQSRWAEVSYQVPEDDRDEAMNALVKKCDALAPDSAEGLVWCGIVRSTYAGMAGPFSAMTYAKGARADLEKAIETDDEVLSGAAYTSLGTLYFKVPGWPVGFGDEDKAQELLQRGLKLNEAGIDSNYFYADYLFEQGEYEQALEYLQIATAASPRAGREVADAGRQQDIASLRAAIEKKSGKK